MEGAAIALEPGELRKRLGIKLEAGAKAPDPNLFVDDGDHTWDEVEPDGTANNGSGALTHAVQDGLPRVLILEGGHSLVGVVVSATPIVIGMLTDGDGGVESVQTIWTIPRFRVVAVGAAVPNG